MCLGVAVPGSSFGCLKKTRLCRFHVKGVCKLGQACGFAHTEGELQPQPDLYKTELCNDHLLGRCRRGSRCRFAHGPEEIRPAAEGFRHVAFAASGLPEAKLVQSLGGQGAVELLRWQARQIQTQLEGLKQLACTEVEGDVQFFPPDHPEARPQPSGVRDCGKSPEHQRG